MDTKWVSAVQLYHSSVASVYLSVFMADFHVIINQLHFGIIPPLFFYV